MHVFCAFCLDQFFIDDESLYQAVYKPRFISFISIINIPMLLIFKKIMYFQLLFVDCDACLLSDTAKTNIFMRLSSYVRFCAFYNHMYRRKYKDAKVYI